MDQRIIEGIEACRPGSDDLFAPEMAEVRAAVEARFRGGQGLPPRAALGWRRGGAAGRRDGPRGPGGSYPGELRRREQLSRDSRTTLGASGSIDPFPASSLAATLDGVVDSGDCRQRACRHRGQRRLATGSRSAVGRVGRSLVGEFGPRANRVAAS